MIKQCRACGTIKPIQEFYGDPAMTDGHKTMCKECYRTFYRDRYWINPEPERERARNYARRRRGNHA